MQSTRYEIPNAMWDKRIIFHKEDYLLVCKYNRGLWNDFSGMVKKLITSAPHMMLHIRRYIICSHVKKFYLPFSDIPPKNLLHLIGNLGDDDVLAVQQHPA
jgi:hypothetical protein